MLFDSNKKFLSQKKMNNLPEPAPGKDFHDPVFLNGLMSEHITP
jgi:hypothetical protein